MVAAFAGGEQSDLYFRQAERVFGFCARNPIVANAERKLEAAADRVPLRAATQGAAVRCGR